LKRLTGRLVVRLLLAHLVVIAVGAVALSLASAVFAPTILEVHLGMMRPPRPMGGPMTGAPGSAALDAALADAFRGAFNQALLVGGLAALIAAAGASALAAPQIAGPVQRLAAAARRVAAGHYEERVPRDSTTELDALATSFNEMAATLHESEQRRLRLIGDVAHELRTPLATLDGYLEGLADGVVEADDEVWALLRDETGRMRRLVEEMHELSRAEAGELSLELTAASPIDLARRATARLAPDFTAKGLGLDATVPQELPLVRADADRAIQVLSNLLSNALRYTAPPGNVWVSAAQEGDAVRFDVRDTGIGLTPEHLPHVFERFYRVDPSRTRALGGAGVGLSIAKALTEAMGGRIWAESDGPGRGTTFSFTLPLDR
jgi:signal transduction histidine kinase